MRYRYLDSFRCGISVFVIFFLRYCGIGYPPMFPSIQYAKFRFSDQLRWDTYRYFTHFIRFKPLTKYYAVTLKFNPLAIYLSHTLELNEKPSFFTIHF